MLWKVAFTMRIIPQLSAVFQVGTQNFQTGFMHLAPTSEHNVLKVFLVYSPSAANDVADHSDSI